jgi:hypothetical protein
MTGARFASNFRLKKLCRSGEETGIREPEPRLRHLFEESAAGPAIRVNGDSLQTDTVMSAASISETVTAYTTVTLVPLRGWIETDTGAGAEELPRTSRFRLDRTDPGS